MKGVEIGDAFANARLPGSAVHDELLYDDARGYWRETQPRRRHRGRHVERRADRRARRDEAAADADEAAALGASRHARGRPTRSSSAATRRRSRQPPSSARPSSRSSSRAACARSSAATRRRRRARRLRALPRAHPVASRADAHRPIVVAGFMGAGKSTVGRAARPPPAAGPFADSDAEVERRAGCSVRALWERDGRGGLPRARGGGRRASCSQRDDAPVIALGGGALDIRGDARAACASARSCAWLDVAGRDVPGERVDGAPGARPLAADRARVRAARHASARRSTAPPPTRSSQASESPADVAGALAQQVWTRPGIAELALRRGRASRSSTARWRSPRAPPSIELEGGEAAKSPRGARAALARPGRARARAQRRGRRAPAAARSPTSAASPPPRSGAACPGSRCRRRSSARSTRRSAARRRSTWPPRTTSAPSGSRRRVLCDPDAARDAAAARVGGRHGRGASRPRCSPAAGCGSSSRAGSRASASAPRAAELVQRCAGVKTLVVAADPRGARARARSSTSGTRSATASRPWPGYGGLSHGECVVDRPRRRAAPLRAARRPRRPARPSARPELLAAPRAARARARARRRGGARGDAPRQEARARDAPDGAAGGVGRPVYGVAVDEQVLAEAVRAATAARRLD